MRFKELKQVGDIMHAVNGYYSEDALNSDDIKYINVQQQEKSLIVNFNSSDANNVNFVEFISFTMSLNAKIMQVVFARSGLQYKYKAEILELTGDKLANHNILFNGTIKHLLGNAFNNVGLQLFDFLVDNSPTFFMVPYGPKDGMFELFTIEDVSENLISVGVEIKGIHIEIMRFTKSSFNLRTLLREYESILAGSYDSFGYDKNMSRAEKWYELHNMQYEAALLYPNKQFATGGPN